MNTRNRIILAIVIAIDIAVFSYALVLKNKSTDYSLQTLSYKTVQIKVTERRSILLSEISTVQDSLKNCCKR